MRGDEAELTAAGGDRTRERSGPRHAAPRKSLLTKLQIPAGKAMALAAMPTAVFVGMGLTPKLALADDQVTNPFAPGPCVTRSDTPDPDASESKSPSAKPSSPTATPSSGTTPGKPAQTETPQPGETPSASASPSASSTAPATDPTKEPEAGETATPKPAPTESEGQGEGETKNPLDPLGVGDAIKDVLDGPDKETASPEPSDTEPADGGSATTKPDATEPDASKPDADEPKDPAAKNPVGDAAGDAADKTEDAIRDAADKVGAKVEELGDEAKGTADDAKDAADDAADGKADDPAADADGKEPFPCPTADPDALANAELEQGIPDLPDDPWILESTKLTLRGLDYKGIVEVRTGSGKIKKVLKFTAEKTDIKDLHQKVVGPNGTTAHVQAADGSTSTIREGTVTMYTEKLKGNLFGLIPVTFSPETPPPLNVPVAVFTDVTVTQAGQFGGTLMVPGLHNFYTG
ncbi:hypothetical protein J7E96_03955 [Streptomyces sp. ISL-96]|uniref:hypothetical protein n=1 Tax=Streptomyces sp. ISL-96 TaxID=2819191 RepID=UPI001BE8AF04|nr:hypothetical protein [Streptomyces sp. ISL-96]MBT2487703.1 hypothetical protein [Streptomyces sp. ISL-96]